MIAGSPHDLPPGRRAGMVIQVALALLALGPWTAARGDRVAYQGVVSLSAAGDGFVVRHHHDWSPATAGSRHRMMATHRDPLREGNDFAYLAWYQGDGRTLIRKVPSPALTWLGVSRDSRYVIGLSSVKLHNPVQVVVYDRGGTLLLRRHVAARLACLQPGEARALHRAHPAVLDAAPDASWVADWKIYVDYELLQPAGGRDLPWKELLAADCPNPLSPSISGSVTSWIHWFDAGDPAPEVIEAGGAPKALRLRDPRGQPLVMPFRLERPRW